MQDFFICEEYNTKQVGCTALELVVWEEVKKILKNPQRIFFLHTYSIYNKYRRTQFFSFLVDFKSNFES